jgi:hypothetical protein
MERPGHAPFAVGASPLAKSLAGPYSMPRTRVTAGQRDLQGLGLARISTE